MARSTYCEQLMFSGLVLALMLGAATAYPSLFVSRYASSCDANLEIGDKYGPHSNNTGEGVTADSSITFTVADPSGSPVAAATPLCPGTTYALSVNWGDNRLHLLTANAGEFADAPEPTCPNREYNTNSASLSTGVSTNFTIPCNITDTTVELVLTSATGSQANHLQNSVTYSIDAACGSCPGAGGPAPVNETAASPSPSLNATLSPPPVNETVSPSPGNGTFDEESSSAEDLSPSPSNGTIIGSSPPAAGNTTVSPSPSSNATSPSPSTSNGTLQSPPPLGNGTTNGTRTLPPSPPSPPSAAAYMHTSLLLCASMVLFALTF